MDNERIFRHAQYILDIKAKQLSKQLISLNSSLIDFFKTALFDETDGRVIMCIKFLRTVIDYIKARTDIRFNHIFISESFLSLMVSCLGLRSRSSQVICGLAGNCCHILLTLYRMHPPTLKFVLSHLSLKQLIETIQFIASTSTIRMSLFECYNYRSEHDMKSMFLLLNNYFNSSYVSNQELVHHLLIYISSSSVFDKVCG